MRVCIDTHILIWGIQKEASTGQKQMISAAQAFLRHLDSEGADILIPSVVLGEFLLRIPTGKHETVRAFFEQRFKVPPYDAASASRQAEVWQGSKDEGVYDVLRGDEIASRSEIRADCMIIGTALAHGAALIYSHDQKTLGKLAKGFIKVLQMPEIAEQRDIFGNAEPQPSAASKKND